MLNPEAPSELDADDRNADDRVPRGDVERALIRDARAWWAASTGSRWLPDLPGRWVAVSTPLGANVPWVDVVEHPAEGQCGVSRPAAVVDA
jgi:hypothetical protein